MAYGASKLYRHGVLVGNWHEDEAGMRLAANPQSNYNASTHYLTETTSHYRAPGPHALIENYMQKQRTGGAQGVAGAQLFRHAGADTYESRYLTTYATANHAVALHTNKQQSLRHSQSAAGTRSPTKWHNAAAAADGDAQSARSPPKSPATATATAAAVAAGGSPKAEAVGGVAAAAKSSGAPGEAKQHWSPSATSKSPAAGSSATGASTLPKAVAFANPFAELKAQSKAVRSVSESAPYHQPTATGAMPPLGVSGGGRNKAGKVAGGTWSRVPKMEVNPVNARAGDLSIEYAAYTLGGRKRPFPTVPDPSLSLDRTAAKLDAWRAERDGALGQRTYQTEHSGTFVTPSQAAASLAATGGGGGVGQAQSAGTTSSQYHRDAQGNLRPHFRKHQQFKVAHDWGALKLRA